MDAESRLSPQSRDSDEYNPLAERLLEKVPTKPRRNPDELPFHIPHKKSSKKVAHEELLSAKPSVSVLDLTASQIKRRRSSLQSRRSLAPPSPIHLPPISRVDDKLPVHTTQRKEKKEVTDIMKPTSMLEVADQRSLIELVQRNKKIGFLYMTYAVPRSSKFFTPYCLRVVPYKNIDKQNFLTISSEGVTQFYPGDMVFTSLQQWEYEYDRYCNLILIKTFSMFRMWKGFYVWRKNVKWKKIHDARKSLNELLFLLNPALRKALLDVQLACNKMVEVYFTDFSNKEKNILFEFMNAQMKNLVIVREQLLEYRDIVKELINCACHKALLSVGFTTDDHNFLIQPSSSATSGAKRSANSQFQMSYMKQINKRRFCTRLTSFIHLIDLMMVGMLHVLVVRSLLDLDKTLQMHLHFLPNDEALNSLATDVNIAPQRPSSIPQLPLFIINLLIDEHTLLLDPPERAYIESLSQLMDFWEETVININTFLPDPYFRPFTEPMICGKAEGRLCGTGPEIDVILKEDKHRLDIRTNIILSIHNNFEAINKYIQRFQFIREFHTVNTATDMESITNETEAKNRIEFFDSTSLVVEVMLWKKDIYCEHHEPLCVPKGASVCYMNALPRVSAHHRTFVVTCCKTMVEKRSSCTASEGEALPQLIKACICAGYHEFLCFIAKMKFESYVELKPLLGSSVSTLADCVHFCDEVSILLSTTMIRENLTPQSHIGIFTGKDCGALRYLPSFYYLLYTIFHIHEEILTVFTHWFWHISLWYPVSAYQVPFFVRITFTFQFRGRCTICGVERNIHSFNHNRRHCGVSPYEPLSLTHLRLLLMKPPCPSETDNIPQASVLRLHLREEKTLVIIWIDRLKKLFIQQQLLCFITHIIKSFFYYYYNIPVLYNLHFLTPLMLWIASGGIILLPFLTYRQSYFPTQQLLIYAEFIFSDFRNFQLQLLLLTKSFLKNTCPDFTFKHHTYPLTSPCIFENTLSGHSSLNLILPAFSFSLLSHFSNVSKMLYSVMRSFHPSVLYDVIQVLKTVFASNLVPLPCHLSFQPDSFVHTLVLAYFTVVSFSRPMHHMWGGKEVMELAITFCYVIKEKTLTLTVHAPFLFTVFKINMKYHEYVQSFSISIELIVNVVTSVTICMKINCQKCASLNVAHFSFMARLLVSPLFFCSPVTSIVETSVSHLYLKLFCLTCQQAFSPNFNFLLLVQAFHLSKCCVEVVFVVIWTHNTTKNALSEVHCIVLSRCTLAYDKTLLMHTAFKCPAPGSGGVLQLASEAEEMALVAVLVAVLEKLHQLHPPVMGDPLHVFSATYLPQVICRATQSALVMSVSWLGLLVIHLQAQLVIMTRTEALLHTGVSEKAVAPSRDDIRNPFWHQCRFSGAKPSDKPCLLGAKEIADTQLTSMSSSGIRCWNFGLQTGDQGLLCNYNMGYENIIDRIMCTCLACRQKQSEQLSSLQKYIRLQLKKDLDVVMLEHELHCLVLSDHVMYKLFCMPCTSVSMMHNCQMLHYEVEGSLNKQPPYAFLWLNVHLKVLARCQTSAKEGLIAIMLECSLHSQELIMSCISDSVHDSSQEHVFKCGNYSSLSVEEQLQLNSSVIFIVMKTTECSENAYYFNEDIFSGRVLLSRRKLHGAFMEKFRKLLTSYHQQIDDINKLQDSQDIGIFQLVFERLKGTVLPVTTALLGAVELTLPRIINIKKYTHVRVCIPVVALVERNHDYYYRANGNLGKSKPCPLFTFSLQEVLMSYTLIFNGNAVIIYKTSVSVTCKELENSNKRRETLVVLYLNIGASLKIDVFKSVCHKLLWWKLLLSHQEELITTCINDKFRIDDPIMSPGFFIYFVIQCSLYIYKTNIREIDSLLKRMKEGRVDFNVLLQRGSSGLLPKPSAQWAQVLQDLKGLFLKPVWLMRVCSVFMCLFLTILPQDLLSFLFTSYKNYNHVLQQKAVYYYHKILEDLVCHIQNVSDIVFSFCFRIRGAVKKIGKEKIDDLVTEAGEAQAFLELEPRTTIQFVEYLTFLDSAQHKVDMMETQMDYCKELYDIIDEFQIPCAPEDQVNYLGFSVTLSALRSVVDGKLTEYPKILSKFDDQINRDISSLFSDVGDVKDEVTQPWLIDVNSNPEEVKLTLNMLSEQLAEFQKKAAEYRGYQRQFKLEITKFELLDEVLNDVKLRQLLWESVEKWDKLIQEWYEADFSTLDPEEMNVTTMRFIKNILQLEKGLPENLILPQLKYNVELMKDKMAVVTYLRNPSLKPRHWLQIEGVLKYKFPTEEPITLRLLECIGVFTFPDELQEISGQASSESGLESLLQKVEDAWKTIEFVVLPHRDSKDVFILGGLEEIQQVLDDSNINMSTITSSRHVGPIKPRVDEWASQLQLFSNTLEAWMLCQQGWMYLESIFSAPDIQRQLPQEDKMFNIVDKSFKDIMRRTAENPLAMQACTAPGLLETFNRNNVLLDQIMKCLEAYLETKRVAFPRFYFLSNDELLEILAQTRNPFAVQPHLRKCFDAIAKLEFGVHEKEGESGETVATVMTTDIVAMISPEGERVALGQGLYARGNVEDWLGKVEEYMFLTLRKRMKFAIGDHHNSEREVWVVSHPAQVILTVSLIIWCENVHLVFMPDKNIKQALASFEKKCFQDLNSLAAMVRGDLSKLNRMIICSLITIDVHARDIITSLVKLNVQNSSHFEWLKQLRYYWEEDIDNCVARMSSACYVYGYEYLGASPRLVITPLTDKCYLCLMGALQLDLGGAPAGPAGTGKTETTKDLAKSLAIQCVVFNCSEGLDYKMMGRFFSGLAQSGAWCCFDEFNRIDIEVLSVIAQQLITIRNAKAAKLARFVFEGREIKLIQTCAAFITMNPGYAGRTELPDNLKALFRPISMMVPDYALIAEVILYSEGFESSKNLANKMVQMYKLCSEQLSQQDHYDFGMRAVKSVLVMAGSLKRENPDKSEDVVLIRALRDSNLPKFLTDDATLFQGILGDLFPGVEIPEQDYGVLQAAIITVMEENDLQPESCMIAKVIQFHETMIVRHGVMLVGPTGGGKTTVINVLKDTLTRLHADGVPGPVYRPVITYVLNPKSVTLGELYGEVNLLTMEWRDGLLGIMVRTACEDEIHQWVICDGPVDAVWIENMNTVLDDNKMLCLANSERIKLTPWVHMVFEVQDLAQASPATVSRCGMVYIDPEELQYMPYVNTWLKNLGAPMPPELKEYVKQLYEGYVDKGLTFVKKNCNHAIAQADISKATMLCGLMESLIMSPGSIDKTSDASRIKNFLCQAYVFSYLWSLGGNLTDASQEKFEIFVKEQFDDHPDARLPAADDLWSVYVNIPQKRMSLWSSIVPAFQFDREMPFFEMLVPTTDTVRFGYVTERLLSVKRHVLLTGDTGVGKSVIAKEVLNKLLAQGDHITVALNFSAQTSSSRTQEIFEAKLERRKKTVLGPPLGKKLVFFVDDVNMPKLDTYGAQPPIELLRQYLDFGGLYDREKLFWKEIQDVVIIAACAPPGGGRNPLTPRFVRHFSMLFIPSPSEFTLKNIFKVILRGFLSDFTNPVKDLGDIIVNSAVEIYNRISEDLLPTPAKSHYVFNLRDLSKCIQGVLQADAGTVREAIQMMRLFYHECLRVFHDRLINIEDKSYFYKLMYEVCNRTYGDPVIQLPEEEIILHPPVLLFGDFMVMGASKEDKVYEEITDIEKFKKVAQDYLEDYNLTTPKEMKLIFFMDALEHITRLARILRAERGNGLLVGVGGMGKQSLTRLAAHLCGYKCFQIELTRNYDHASFHDDLRLLYFNAGALNQDTAFLFTDSQIVSEEFLEDINNILNSGEVPNLFESDEYEKVIIASRNDAKEAGIDEGNRDGIFEFFISRVRSRLHLVLCMSPVGDAFRRRCRMFPSLVNCCTIDWFVEWPQEALLSVASTTLAEVGTEELIEKLSTMCVTIHESVAQMTVRFYNEMRRYYYTTPSSYLELLKLYLTMLQNKTDQLQKKHDRIANGLRKLYETNELIDRMKIELTAMEPELKQKSIDAVELMKHLVKEQAQADKVRKIVVADEAVVKVKAQETQQLADEAQRDLDAALPAMEAAMKALESLNKNDINELRVFTKPPQLVKFVMESVCLLMGAKTDWASAKTLLGDTNFLKRLQDYEKDNITDNMLKKLKQYVDHPDFTPETVAGVSKVCKSICMWVRAIDCYAKAYRIVQPKKAKLAAAEQELNQIMSVLREKQQALAAVEKQIADLEATYDRSVNEKAELERMMELTANRLVRAGHLTTALGDEQLRWEKSVKDLKVALITVVGDVLVAAACVAYLGAFTNNYRVELVQKWVEHIMALEIPASEVFSLINVLADQFEIRQWNVYGLPRDNVSTENAIMVTKGSRWPLMIDPQEQASRWIRQMESENQIKIVKLTDAGFMRSLEGAVRVGMPVLLEELGETLDPTLGPILLRQTFVQGGRLLIHLGDSDVEYDPNFRFYMTTKLSNPHYLPEVCIQVTIVNFTVTRSGLEDQLLSDVVRLERPDLEKQRNELITRINNDKTQLQNIEDKILRMLFTSEGNILDDEELIETLNKSKETSGTIAARLVEAEATEHKISVAREKYRTVAARGSVLYFVVAQLAEIDPMYQYSLRYFNQVFNTVIETSEKSDILDVRLMTLLAAITLAVYTNVSRGLFERHKLVFSFLLCINILKHAGEITEAQWGFLLRGPIKLKKEEKPDIPTLSDAMWMAVNFLDDAFPSFKGITNDALKAIPVMIGTFKQVINLTNDSAAPIVESWDQTLSMFEKLMLLKALKEEKLVFAITAFVREKQGQSFIESPQVSLHVLYKDTSNVVPLIFVLSTGSDPFGAFQRFATEKGFRDRILSISLGQGQGPVAEKLIGTGTANGDWVFLQNCHLATSWMLSMEKIIIGFSENPEQVNPDFRLFLSSMPSKSFPVSVLQNSVKVTNEPPKGLRANIKRAFLELTEDFFEDHPLGPDWRKMIFGICFFHGVIQERKKFGPLGWNITYEFNDSDRECALNTMKMFCAENSIPWDALEYITGEITYGGRVTDSWDLRCLKTILKGFFSPKILKSGYIYSASGVYYCPESEDFSTLEQYRNFIDQLPIIEEPEIFGMHENANIAFQVKETQTVILTILDVQPRESSGAEGKSSDEIIFELADAIRGQIRKKLDPDEIHPSLLVRDEKGRLPSLTTVLLQETDRFNKLCHTLHSSLDNLQKAIKGLVVMSEALEEMFISCMNNQVPKMWATVGYLSLKSLGSWIRDLETRLDLIQTWLTSGQPISFWISGFFFPQGFLTGTLQTHARKYELPIDQLKFEFTVQKVVLDQELLKAAHYQAEGKEVPEMYEGLKRPSDGVLVHGIFLDASRWDLQTMTLCDPNPGEMNPPLPVTLLTPVTALTYKGIRYVAPLYKTSERAGVLSTTGHSTNFVIAFYLPSKQEESYWILKGAALLTQITD
ncbi:dynein axonemal heavy chain 6 [Schistocerca nitens]|uniref:dynein axonemal heavy chain 6 n=1 Tax=Schistocerca nitens TaxID=7011 RepID=UPI002118589F|nr:dynein axonemal heavy chain 6 [Schistocerca nitens]